MDGVCVSKAIAVTCRPAISFLVGREADECGIVTIQTHELWKFLEVTTTAALIRACAWRQEQMLALQLGADESLELHIARLQHVESELCMVSEDPKAVHASLAMKLVTSVNYDYSMAVTMSKNILLS